MTIGINTRTEIIIICTVKPAELSAFEAGLIGFEFGGICSGFGRSEEFHYRCCNLRRQADRQIVFSSYWNV